jgi:hypothetical protein
LSLTLMSRGVRMATLSDLVSAIAEAEGLDQPTVAVIARYVREAGFIQKKGRGPSAASMAAADAASLLIAVNASTSAIGASEIVPVYRDLVGVKYDNFRRNSKINGTFGEALELLIQSAIDCTLPSSFLSAVTQGQLRNAFEQEKFDVVIGFEKPDPKTTILISPEKLGMDKSGYSFLPASALSFSFVPLKARQGPKQMKASDRTDYTQIGSVTIFSIAKTLRSPSRKGSIASSGR